MDTRARGAATILWDVGGAVEGTEDRRARVGDTYALYRAHPAGLGYLRGGADSYFTQPVSVAVERGLAVLVLGGTRLTNTDERGPHDQPLPTRPRDAVQPACMPRCRAPRDPR